MNAIKKVSIIVLHSTYRCDDYHPLHRKSPPVVQHLNVDNIEMQPSPAYVPFSQDSKVSSTVAEY